MQAESPNPFYYYNTLGPPPQLTQPEWDICRQYSEEMLYNLLEELDDVLGTGPVIPHIPRPFRFQGTHVLTRVDANGRFVSRLTPHSRAFALVFTQDASRLTVTFSVPGLF